MRLIYYVKMKPFDITMESFFGRLKTECFYGREFKTKEEIVDAVRDYLDYYNHRRIQLKLKGLSPIQYRKQSF